MAADLADRLREDLAAPLAGAGAELEGVRVLQAGGRRLVRVLVDTPTGITLDELAAVTRVASSALDSSPHLGERPYVLEVSSPGVERPLTMPRHWRRNTGRLVRVRTREGTVVGRIKGLGEGDTTVLLDGVGGNAGILSLPFDSIDRAVIQVEFNRPDGTEE